MAFGDSKKASAYTYYKGTGRYNNSTDTFKWVLVTNTYASIDEDADTLELGDLTQVASVGAYVANESLTGVTWTKDTGGPVSRFDFDNLSFAANGSNPTTACCLVVYNDTSTNKDIFEIVDLTTDGTTPADTALGFTYTVNANGAGTSTANA